MKVRIKDIFAVIVVALCIAALIYGCLQAHIIRAGMDCTGIKVEVLDSAENKFLDRKEVIRLIDRDFGGYVNRPADSVNLMKVEKVLKSQGFVDKAEAYFNNDGMLNIRITQKKPVLKICRDSTFIAYLDGNGGYFPVSTDWCEGLNYATGHPKIDDSEWTARLAALSKELDIDRNVGERIKNIECLENGEIILWLEGREEAFELGQPVEIKDKLWRIGEYLEKVVPFGEKYNTVIIKYSGQIVCKK